jgi:hypothetical protein
MFYLHMMWSNSPYAYFKIIFSVLKLIYLFFQEELSSLELAYEPVSNTDIMANSGYVRPGKNPYIFLLTP